MKERRTRTSFFFLNPKKKKKNSKCQNFHKNARVWPLPHPSLCNNCYANEHLFVTDFLLSYPSIHLYHLFAYRLIVSLSRVKRVSRKKSELSTKKKKKKEKKVKKFFRPFISPVIGFCLDLTQLTVWYIMIVQLFHTSKLPPFISRIVAYQGKNTPFSRMLQKTFSDWLLCKLLWPNTKRRKKKKKLSFTWHLLRLLPLLLSSLLLTILTSIKIWCPSNKEVNILNRSQW